jgi:selenocysteine lyase/cysteine desulfurase
MLMHAEPSIASFFSELRSREFGRLEASGCAYLDYAGAALYGQSQLEMNSALLAEGLYGNPHSDHGSSRASTRAINEARRRVLGFLDAGDEYDVIFTANATAAVKLVAESYPFGAGAPCILTADNHNSVNGIREFARRRGGAIVYLPLREDLRLDHPEARLDAVGGAGLFAFPAQSNFSGVHHPLSLVRYAQALGHHVLLDAAAFVPASPLSLRMCPADFVVLSFYKIFGYPTGVGALVARREALAALDRPWFAGGTVQYASVQIDRHRLRDRHERFEDGTPSFLGIAALDAGFSLIDRVGAHRTSAHVQALTKELLDGLLSIRHAGGAPLVRVYGPHDMNRRGGTVAFNVLDPAGRALPYSDVEHRADERGVHLRGGCFCNPGAAEAAFRLDGRRMRKCLELLDPAFSIEGLRRCVGRDTAIGAVRASIGVANNLDDVRRALNVIASFTC